MSDLCLRISFGTLTARFARSLALDCKIKGRFGQCNIKDDYWKRALGECRQKEGWAARIVCISPTVSISYVCMYALTEGGWQKRISEELLEECLNV